MYSLSQLLPLLLALPFLASPVSAGSGAGTHYGLRSRSHNHVVYVERSLAEMSLEAMMAKRASGRRLANRAASNAQCRLKGSKYVASSSTATRSATATSTTSASTTSTRAASTTTTTSPAASSPTAASGGGGGGGPSNIAYGSFTPNGIKAGITAGDAYDYFKDHIGWWYDWTPNPQGHSGRPIAASMIWGAGTADGEDASRLGQFRSMNWNPSYVIGFEEPDCPAGEGSAGFDVDTGVALWNSLVAPKGAGGSILISPSMCKQAAESGWLGPFRSKISRDWDITNVHINKNSAAGINQDLDHYWNTYGKPMWITEFACVDDSTGFVPCEDQSQINDYIWTAVKIFEADSRVAGYAYSNGWGLGTNWPLMKNGQLSDSGKTYLSAISQYH